MSEANRRAHPRHPMEMAITVRDRHPDAPTGEIDGVTINVSLGGVLALLDQKLSVGPESNCLVRFKDASGFVEPEYRWGVALRSTPVDDGYEVAIAFQTLLEKLLPPEESEAASDPPPG